MAYKKKSHILKLHRTRPAIYRENINKKNFLLIDRQELIFNTGKISSNKLDYTKLELNYYPELSKFYNFLAKFLNVSKKKIFITEGCTGGIKQVIESYAYKGSNIVAPYPTFVLYEVFSKLYNVHLKKVYYQKDLKLTLKSYLDKIDKKTSVVFLTNPGSPNDFVFKKKEIEKIILFCKKKNIIVALDDAYYPYYNLDLTSFINKYNNFIVLRTLSKYYGLASLRVGFIISNAKNVNYLSKFRGGYEINTPTMEIVKKIIVNTNFFKKKKNELDKSKNFLISEFKKHNIKIKSFGNSNYLCVSVLNKLNIQKIVKIFFKKKIIIRYNLPKPFEDCILFTLPNLKEAKKILNILLKNIKN
jgi:histidinol-phosphate aminotransferase